MVVRAEPFHCTTESETKLLPVTDSVKPPPPAMAEVGLRAAEAGAGLGAALMVITWGLEVPPPGVGLKTVTWGVPAEAMSSAEMAAVNWVAET